MNKQKEVEKVRADLEKKYKRPILLVGSDIHMVRVPSGLMSVDNLMGGGIPKGRWIMCYGSKGCIDGNTFISYEIRNKKGSRQNNKGGTIEHLFERFHGIQKKGKGYYQRKQTINSAFYVSSVDEKNRIVKNKVIDVVDSGEKEVYEIISELGFKLLATMDHKFYIGNDMYLSLDKLNSGDTIYVNNGKHIKNGKVKKYYPKIYVKYHPYSKVKYILDKERGYKNKYYRIRQSLAVYEANMNSVSLKKYLSLLNEKNIVGLKFINRDKYQIHHIDKNPLNDTIDNLKLVTQEEHNKIHYDDIKNNCLYKVVTQDRIKSIIKVGKRHTYDIMMESPHHNFIANNFVVHNSGKTSLTCKIMATVQESGGIAVYIDAEHAYDRDYAASIGVDNDKLIYTRPETLEESMTTLQKLAPVVDFIAIDSIVAVGAASEIERELEKETMALIPRKLSQFFRVCTPSVGKSNALVILVNQTRTDLGAFIPFDKYPGGNALAHSCSFIMQLRRGSPKDDPVEKIDGKDVLIGHRIHIKAEKTKISDNEGSSSFFDLLRKPPHFDEVTDVLFMAEMKGVVTNSGAWFYYEKEKYQGRNGIVEALNKDEKLFNKIKGEVKK